MPRPRRTVAPEGVSKTDDVIEAPDMPFPPEYLVHPGEDWRETALGRLVAELDTARRTSRRLSGQERELILPLCDFLLSQSGATFEPLSEVGA